MQMVKQGASQESCKSCANRSVLRSQRSWKRRMNIRATEGEDAISATHEPVHAELEADSSVRLSRPLASDGNARSMSIFSVKT